MTKGTYPISQKFGAGLDAIPILYLMLDASWAT